MNIMLGRWAFIIGLIISVAAGFIDIGLQGIGILFVLGVIVGLLNVTSRDVSDFLLATITLIVIAAAGLSIPLIGDLLSSMLSAFISFVAGAALVVALKEVITITGSRRA